MIHTNTSTLDNISIIQSLTEKRLKYMNKGKNSSNAVKGQLKEINEFYSGNLLELFRSSQKPQKNMKLIYAAWESEIGFIMA